MQLEKTSACEFYEALDSIPVPIFVKDITGTFTNCNEAYEKFMGLHRDEIIGKSVYDIAPENLADQYHAKDTELFQTGKEQIYEGIVTIKGMDHYVLFHKSIYRSVVGEIKGLVGTITDITEQKKAEQSLRASEEKNKALLEAIPDGMAIITPEFKIVEFKKAREFVHIGDIKSFIGKTLTDVLPEEVATLYMENITLAIQARKVTAFEYQIVHNQETRYREARGIVTSDGNVLVMIRDITDKKLMAETLEKQSAEIKDALANLKQTQMQLVQQEKLAGIGQLAAGVAHEINNPLGFVLSNFDSLKQYLTKITDVFHKYGELKDKVLESDAQNLQELAQQLAVFEKKKKIAYIFDDLEPIIQESDDGLKRLGEIVKALKLFSRVDKNSEFECYDLNAGIRNTLIVAKNEIKYVAEMEVDLGEMPEIQASAGQINQVLLNIIINAAHAIKEKQMDNLGMIRITSYHDDQFVYCSVQDNGLGMTAETREKIFNAFFTTKPSGQGTGLGLSISYDIIVNKHGGDISVTSEKGMGTTFTIKLPLLLAVNMLEIYSVKNKSLYQ